MILYTDFEPYLTSLIDLHPSIHSHDIRLACNTPLPCCSLYGRFQIQADADKFHYLWVFHTDNMRNNCMQYVRTQWAGSRICLGRNAVMRKALGDTVESEHRSGCSSIASLLEGDVGLLFTDEEPQVVTDWFGSYTKADFARAGNVATEDVTLPEGPVVMGDENAPHSIEPQLRKLGMPTTLKKGVPTLANPYTICKEGQKLSPDQAHLLKLFGKAMATVSTVLGRR